MKIMNRIREVGLLLIPAMLTMGMAGTAWAVDYAEGIEPLGDLSDDSEEPTVLLIDEDSTITGSMRTVFGGEAVIFDPDHFRLDVAPGVDIISMTVEHEFVGDATSLTWYGPSTFDTYNVNDPVLSAFLPNESFPLSEGTFDFGFSAGNTLPSPFYSAVYNYTITITTNVGTPVPLEIEADPSDFTVGPVGVIDESLTALGVGDAGCGDDVCDDYPRVALIKFDITALANATVNDATLRLSIIGSEQSGDPDSTEPFGNFALGDVVVERIPDYLTPDTGDETLIALDDPTVLVDENVNPLQDVSVDVLAAVQQAIQAGDDWVAFRIRTVIPQDADGYSDFFSIASANHPDLSVRPVLDLTASAPAGPVVVIPPTSIPPVGVPGAPLIDRTIDPETPIELLVTVKATGDEPVRIWKCASKDPRWDEVTQTWTWREAAITEFNCPDVPGLAEMDNIVPTYLTANINDEGQAWVGFIFADSAIDFTDVVTGQALWENVDGRIKADGCGVAAADRDVDAWGSLTAGPFLEERFLEDEYFQVATGQCNRGRMIVRRGSVFSGPWNDEISPQRLVWNQFMASVLANGSAESRACVPGSIRFGIFINQFAGGISLWVSQDYEYFIGRMEAADKIAADNSGAYASCSVNVLGEVRSHLSRAAFTAFDRILHPAPEGTGPDGYIKYPAPNHTFPADEPPPVIQ
jgi:hypothetical protein